MSWQIRTYVGGHPDSHYTLGEVVLPARTIRYVPRVLSALHVDANLSQKITRDALVPRVLLVAGLLQPSLPARAR